jgi:hypothetical protein
LVESGDCVVHRARPSVPARASDWKCDHHHTRPRSPMTAPLTKRPADGAIRRSRRSRRSLQSQRTRFAVHGMTETAVRRHGRAGSRRSRRSQRSRRARRSRRSLRIRARNFRVLPVGGGSSPRAGKKPIGRGKGHTSRSVTGILRDRGSFGWPVILPTCALGTFLAVFVPAGSMKPYYFVGS